MAMKDISDEQVCRAVQAYQDAMRAMPKKPIYGNTTTYDSPHWPYEALALETGQCEKVCYRAMERACDRDLIEFGMSLRTGWLTDKGKELLR